MATELGKAFVQIVPSAKGISKEIQNAMGPDIDKAGASAGQSLGTGLLSKLKGVLVAAGIGGIITSAINQGGELEQNLGGTEAVFGDFASNIKNAATEAYKNMGMSASDYMATANKMGALFQGSGLEQERAMELSSAAMQRAADVASVMGIDMTDAMESIAGAAKSNFTMMDNLGVAMNATTLQAYALEKGINFDWNTANNAEKAELAMQMFMERTTQYAGNFARESEETFSGSLGAMKSAFTDLMANLATGQDILPALSNLSTTLVSFAKNLIPMLAGVIQGLPAIFINTFRDAGPSLLNEGMLAIGNLAVGIGQAIPGLITAFSDGLLQMLKTIPNLLPQILQGAAEIISGLATGIQQALPTLLEQVPEIIQNIVSVLLENIPLIVQAGVDLLTALVDALPDIIVAIVEVLPTIIDSIVKAFNDNIPLIIQAGIDLLTSLIKDLPTIIKAIVDALPQIITSIVSVITENIPLIIQAGIDLLTSLVEALPEIIQSIVSALPQIIDSIIKAVIGNIPLIVQAGLDLLTALIGALPEIIMAIVEALPEIIDSIITTLIDNIPLIIEAGVSLFTAILGDLPLIIFTLVTKVPEIIESLVSALADGIPKFVDMGWQLLQGLAEGIGDAVGGVIKKVKKTVGNIVSSVKGFFGIHSPSRVFSNIGLMNMLGLAQGIEDNIKPISKAMDQVEAEAVRSFESDVNMDLAKNSLANGAELMSSYQLTKDGEKNKEPMIVKFIMNSRVLAQQIVGDISSLQEREVELEMAY